MLDYRGCLGAEILGHSRKNFFMISDLNFKIIYNTNRDCEGIKRAEMDYFHALQNLYAAVQDAVANQGR